jgi:hypothetical protein
VPVADRLSASEHVPVIEKTMNGFKKVSAGQGINE